MKTITLALYCCLLSPFILLAQVTQYNNISLSPLPAANVQDSSYTAAMVTSDDTPPHSLLFRLDNISDAGLCNKYRLGFYATNANHYRVYYRHNAGGIWASWVHASTIPDGIFSYTFSALDPTLNYEFRVEAANTYGNISSEVLSRDACCFYDITHYPPITGSIVWSPATNPVTLATGVPVSIITVGSDFTIASGGSLTLQGITLQMAKDKFVIVQAGTLSTPGGRLLLNNSTITAHRGGCDNPAFNMWGGIRLLGIPSLPQGPVATSKQGYLSLTNNSQISFAHTAVQVGDLTTHHLAILGTTMSFPAFSAGGGIVQVVSSKFVNNNNGIVFFPYSYTNPLTGISGSVLSYFHNTTFLSTNPATIVNGSLKHISGLNIKGIRINGSEFINNSGIFTNSYGIYASNMGFTVDNTSLSSPYSVTHSRFYGFGTAIYHSATGGTSTATIRNAEFHNNYIGVELSHTQSAVIAGNKFNVPLVLSLSPTLPSRYFTYASFRTVGIMLHYANLFSIYNNDFRCESYGRSSSSDNNTVGVLAYNTGSQNNSIYNNTFKGLGIANLANYNNRYGLNGLWYKCNNMSGNDYDIAVRGSFPGSVADGNAGHGIRNFQGLPSGYSIMGYPFGLPAGNTFSSGSSLNIFKSMDECRPFEYYCATPSFGGLPENLPGVPGITGYVFDGTVLPNIRFLSAPNQCNLDIYSPLGVAALGGKQPIYISENWRVDEKYTAITNNINYYMANEKGAQHRDSLYYWVSQLNSHDAQLMTADMLLEEGFLDSAFAVYNSIATSFQMSTEDSMAYAYWGKKLFTIQMAQAAMSGASHKNSTRMLTPLIAMPFSSWQSFLLRELAEVHNNAEGWARVRAKNMLQYTSKEFYESVISQSPDTVLYAPPLSNVAIIATQKSVTLDNIIAFPNPASDILNIHYNQSPLVTICIIDVLGRVVAQQEIINSNTAIFKLSSLPAGTYIYNVSMPDATHTGEIHIIR